jgi:O-antigen/teichoic acid export membrane protein
MSSGFLRFSRQTLLGAVATGIVYARNLLVMPLLTKGLGAAGYGVWVQLFVGIELVAGLVILGFNFSLLRYVPQRETRRDELDDLVSALLVGLSVALVGQIVLISTSDWIAATLLGDPDLTGTVRRAGWVVPFAASGLLILSYLRGSRRVTFFVLCVSLETGTWLAVVGYLFQAGAGLEEMILGLLLIKSIVVFAALLVLLKGRVLFPTFSHVGSYLRHGIPLLPLGILVATVNASDRYILGFFQGAEAAGVYSVSYGLGSIVGLVFAPVFFVLIPATAASWEKDRLDEVRVYLGFAYKYPLIVSIPMLFLLTTYSRNLISAIATPEFYSTWMLVAAVGSGIAIMNLGAIVQTILILQDKSTKILTVSVVAATVNLIGNFVFVPRYGLQGAALVTLATYCLQAWMIHMMTRTALAFPWQRPLLGKLLISTVPLAVAAVLILSGRISGLLGAAVTGLTLVLYFTLLLVQGGVERREWRFVATVIGMSKSETPETVD